MVTGMRDFLPKEKQRREQILSTIRSTYQKYGFDEIETPALEDISALRTSDGGDNTKMTFDILKRRITPETLSSATTASELVDLGLRFDLTVPLSRFYASNKDKLPEVFRSIQIAPVWRAERPQKGRYRQFIQCDIDIIGEQSSFAEVELVTVTAAVLKNLGLTNLTVRMNDRNLLNRFLDANKIADSLKNKVLVILDKKDKMSEEKLTVELAALGLPAEKITNLLSLYVLEEEDGLSDVIKLINDIAGYEVAIFDPTLVRGMGYYTGTIFEISSETETYSLGGGGRYDNMIERFAGTSVPAVGFSLGFERIVDLVELSSEQKQSNVALIYDAEDSGGYIFKLSAGLIESGCRVRLVKKAKNTRRQLDILQKEGFTEFAFVNSSSVSPIELRPFGLQGV